MNRFSPRAQGGIAVTLCLVAGFVDAIAYLRSDVFVANMTGNTVLIGIAVARHDWATSAFRIATVAVFFFGAVAGRVLVSVTAERRWVPLVIETLLIVAVCVLPYGHWLWTLLLATAMGVQSTAITQFGGVAVNTVVVTGAISRVAERVADVVLGAGARAAAPQVLLGRMQAAAWGAYGVGALFAALAARVDASLLLPAACVAAVAILLAVAPRR